MDGNVSKLLEAEYHTASKKPLDFTPEKRSNLPFGNIYCVLIDNDDEEGSSRFMAKIKIRKELLPGILKVDEEEGGHLFGNTLFLPFNIFFFNRKNQL